MRNRRGVLTLLERLGSTADEVAAELLNLKCTGLKDSGVACPVAMYLTYKGLNEVVVGQKVEWAGQKNRLSVDIPKAVESFTRWFDDGNYPELDEEMPEAVRLVLGGYLPAT